MKMKIQVNGEIVVLKVKKVDPTIFGCPPLPQIDRTWMFLSQVQVLVMAESSFSGLRFLQPQTMHFLRLLHGQTQISLSLFSDGA